MEHPRAQTAQQRELAAAYLEDLRWHCAVQLPVDKGAATLLSLQSNVLDFLAGYPTNRCVVTCR